MKNIKNIIEAHFASIIGQVRVLTDLALMLLSIENGGPAKSKLFTGAAGLGKTMLMQSYASALRLLGWHVVFFNSPDEIVGDAYNALCTYMRDNLAPIAVFIDEAHRLNAAGKRTSVKRMSRFIQKATDTMNLGKEVSENDGEIYLACLDFHRITFVMGTNYPSKLEEFAKSDAMQSRVDVHSLETYSSNEAEEIFSRMVKSKGLNIAEGTRRKVTACARGTARPLAKIAEKLATMQNASGGKATLNAEQVMLAIRLSELFPAGLSADEIRMLVICAKPQRQNILSSQLPNTDVQAFKKSLAFLQGKQFVEHLSTGFITSAIGARYLAEIVKAGFELPEIG